MSDQTNNIIKNLKEELLKEIRLLENKMNSKFEDQSHEISKINTQYSSKYEEISNNNKSILANFVDQKIKLDKLDEIEKFKNKVESMLLTHEIRINNSIEDLNKAKIKYDKTLTQNLTINGFVGQNCQYKTIAECIIFTINDIQKMKNENNYLKKEIKDVRNKMDSLMGTTLTLINNSISRCNSYTVENIQELKKDIQKNLDEINSRIEKSENNFNNHNEKSENDLNKLNKVNDEIKNNLNKMKIDYTELINENNKKVKILNEDIEEKINDFSEQINIIKSIVNQSSVKATNFDNIIKDIRGRYCKMYNDVYRNKQYMSTIATSDINSPDKTNSFRTKRNSINYDKRQIKISNSNKEQNDNDKKEENKEENREEKKDEKINSNINKKTSFNNLMKKMDKNNEFLFNDLKQINERNNLYHNFDKEKDTIDIPFINYNSKFDKENKHIKYELSNDNINSPKMTNLSRNTDNILDSYSYDKKTYENVYKLASLSYGKNMKYDFAEYSLAAKKSNKRRVVNIDTEVPLSTRFKGLHYRNKSNAILNGNGKEVPCKIGAVFGRTVYTFYNKKEEKYSNLIAIKKNIKKNKSLNANDIDFSLLPVGKIKINVDK